MAQSIRIENAHPCVNKSTENRGTGYRYSAFTERGDTVYSIIRKLICYRPTAIVRGESLHGRRRRRAWWGCSLGAAVGAGHVDGRPLDVLHVLAHEHRLVQHRRPSRLLVRAAVAVAGGLLGGDKDPRLLVGHPGVGGLLGAHAAQRVGRLVGEQRRGPVPLHHLHVLAVQRRLHLRRGDRRRRRRVVTVAGALVLPALLGAAVRQTPSSSAPAKDQRRHE
uniref:Uncharacterized protein n=1 Tax=Setaria italica TaxID=4555 RepID=K3XZ89_SETIT